MDEDELNRQVAAMRRRLKRLEAPLLPRFPFEYDDTIYVRAWIQQWLTRLPDLFTDNHLIERITWDGHRINTAPRSSLYQQLRRWGFDEFAARDLSDGIIKARERRQKEDFPLVSKVFLVCLESPC